MIELGKETERVILVGVSLTEQEDTRNPWMSLRSWRLPPAPRRWGL